LQELSQRKYVSSYGTAIVHIGLGEKDQALECLQRAYQERAAYLVYLKVDPKLDARRDSPVFSDLLERMAFPI
jgi:hypothetical protein